MARVAAGESTEAIEVLYQSYERRLYGLGVRLLGDRGMAEDLVQESFVRLWRSAPRFDVAQGSVSTFVFTIARRVAVDFQRRRAVRPPAATPGQEAQAQEEIGDDAFERLLTSLEVREALCTLSDKHRQVLDLHYTGDLSQRQIAEHLEVPLGTVKTRTYHALLALRSELEERSIVA